MKIVIVNPIWTLLNLLPTNLAELAGYIRAHGYNEIAIVDLNYELRNEFDANYVIERSIDIINAQKPDVIGITCNTIHLPFCVEFCRKYKQRFKTPIILGGIHATFRANHMFQLTKADYIVRGEGEETFLELLDALRGKKQVSRIRGCSFKKGNKIIHNPDRPLIKDLSVLPFPAYDLLLPYIQQLRKGCWGVKEEVNRISILASRGCPFSCIFCSSSKMWHYQRRKPVTRVIEEIQYLTEKCHKKDVSIEDDCLNLNKKWLSDLLQEIKKLNITWSCSMRIDIIDSNLLKRMQKAGCQAVYHGIESGSSKIRTILDKKFSPAITNDSIVNLVREEIKIGIASTCSFMTGIPTETKQDLYDTINLYMKLRNIGANVQFWIMTPYPDIKAVETYKNKLIKINRWQTLRQSDIYTPEQLFLYHKFYYKYTEENPDFYMFKPNMKLTDFFKTCKELQRQAIFSVYHGTTMGNYITEVKGERCFIIETEKVKLGNNVNKTGVSSIYISIEYPFGNTNKIIRYLHKINPRNFFLSIKGSNIKWSMETRQIIFQFLSAIIDKNVQINLTRPIPLWIFNRKQRDLIRKISMPKSCQDCYELFKINKRGNIELCTGTELFKKESADSRKNIVYLLYRIALLENKATNCIFSHRQQILKFLKRTETSDSYMREAKRFFLNRSYDDTMKFLMKAKKYGYDAWDLYYYLGLCYKKKEKFDIALDKLKEAERRNFGESGIHFAMAQCYKHKRDFNAMWMETKKGLKGQSQQAIDKQIFRRRGKTYKS